MKFKLVLLINFYYLIGLAQENELFEHNWYLESIYLNGVNYEEPNLHDVFSSTFFTTSTMFTFMCETGGILGNINIDTENSEIYFTNIFFDNGECTGNESIEFRDLFYSFFQSSETPYLYSISTDENGISTLLLEKSGNSVTYKNLLPLPPETILQNTWYLSDLIIEGTNNPPVQNQEFPYIYLEFKENNGIKSQVCGHMRGLSDFYENPYFFLQTLEREGVNCEMTENFEYENLYFSFFWNNYDHPFEYSVSENGNGNLVLTITDLNGSQAIYSNQLMSIQESEKLNLTIYPNPIQDKLYIEEDERKINSLKIRNASGKLILTENIVAKQTEINFSSLPAGVYFISFEQNGKVLKTEKVLKK